MAVSPRPKEPKGALDLSRHPAVYDAAFSWDRSREARTYLSVACSWRGRAPNSAVELASGSGPLARRWAAWGLTAYGVDRSPWALARARVLGRGIVPEQHWILGDLSGFRLPRRVELAVVPMDGLGYLTEETELLGFFRSARRCLVPGGVLALDLTLHREGARPLPIRNAWTVALRPAGRLRILWRSQGRPWGHPPRRWETARVTVRAPDRSLQIFWEAEPHAILSAHSLAAIAGAAGGFGEMRIFSNAAHRERSARLRRRSSHEGAVGPRLVGWQRL
ncbi:MAG: methyltransferase domain-containing protein [Thermoplasmata archaeon]